MGTQTEEAVNPGMVGLVVAETRISTVGQGGHGLTYRGYAIEDLAAEASFEEVAHLLLVGWLPDRTELADFGERLAASRVLPAELTASLAELPETTSIMDVLRTAVSVLGCLDTTAADRDALVYLTGALPAVLVHWWRRLTDLGPVTETGGSTIEFLAAGLADDRWLPEQVRALEVSLILYAEHDLNASTFTARVITSTNADVYSSVAGAIGALKGDLHGGANEAATELIGSYDDPDTAEKGVVEMLGDRKLIMGFGHRVYRTSDPRSDLIKAWAEKLAGPDDRTFHEVALRIEQVMRDHKNLFPNLDFFSADVYHSCGIAPALCTPLFVVSRITGWGAHVLEQRAEAKILRPSSRYTGPPPCEYVGFEDRGVR
jgi:2-methylcitrate synthase